MRIIVTHRSPDVDAATSVWLIKRFLPSWENAEVKFVPAGEKITGVASSSLRESKSTPFISTSLSNAIEKIGDDEVIHVDTGLGTLDHHQIADTNVCATSLTFDYILKNPKSPLFAHEVKKEAVRQIVDLVIDNDHFQEVYYPNPLSPYHDFTIEGISEGLKIEWPGRDKKNLDFLMTCLDLLLHTFEKRIWAEREIREKGQKFETRYGKGIALETVNDMVLALGIKMGYIIVVKRDPKRGFVRIKTRPIRRRRGSELRKMKSEELDIDLTPVYEKLKEMDPKATWFLHVSRKMLLNGSSKNPAMRATKVDLPSIVKVIKEVL